ncbi:MAG: hypothetical protein LC134_04975, partial [Chitinophagales bacterium]|nr:hypothetical protein [Chitinophagales bacterium]
IKMGYDNMLWGLGLEEDNSFAFYKINPYNGEYTLVYSFQKPANVVKYFHFFLVSIYMLLFLHSQ